MSVKIVFPLVEFVTEGSLTTPFPFTYPTESTEFCNCNPLFCFTMGVYCCICKVWSMIDGFKEQCICIKVYCTLEKTALEMQVAKMGFIVMTQKTNNNALIKKPVLFSSKSDWTSRGCGWSVLIVGAFFIRTLFLHIKQLTSIPVRRFCTIWESKSTEMSGTVAEPGLVVWSWPYAGAHCFVCTAVFGY